MRLPLQNKLLASEISQHTAACSRWRQVAGPALPLYLGDDNAPAEVSGTWPIELVWHDHRRRHQRGATQISWASVDGLAKSVRAGR